MKSARLIAYLELENAMLALDAENDDFAETIRAMMDPLWRSLTKDDREYLDARGAILDANEVFCEPPLPSVAQERSAVEISGWECPV